MGLMEFIASTAGAVIGRQIYDSGPRLSVWLIKRAARRLPKKQDRERREEEWLAHLADVPGLAGLWHAGGAFVASYRIFLPCELWFLRFSAWLLVSRWQAHLYYLLYVEANLLRMYFRYRKLDQKNPADELTLTAEDRAKLSSIRKLVWRMALTRKDVAELRGIKVRGR